MKRQLELDPNDGQKKKRKSDVNAVSILIEMSAHIPSQLENILVAAVKKQSEVRRTAHRNRIDELVFSRKPGKKTPYIDSRSESLNAVNLLQNSLTFLRKVRMKILTMKIDLTIQK